MTADEPATPRSRYVTVLGQALYVTFLRAARGTNGAQNSENTRGTVGDPE